MKELRKMIKDKPLSFQIWIVISIMCSLVTILTMGVILFTFINYDIINIDKYNDTLISSIIKIFICSVIFTTVVAKMIAEKITDPIKTVEIKMKQISYKKWDKQIVGIDRQDEIGNLVNSLVSMQNSLIKMEEEEVLFLQSVSHGLKTPIMVIKNCCQAFRDGIYIHDSQEESIQVIEEEADGLQDTIKKFLMINSFEYMLGQKSDFKEVKIRRLLRDLVDRLSMGNKKLAVDITGEEYSVWGASDLIKNAVNNILENAIRHATSYIHIEIAPDRKDEMKYILITVTNDGEIIPEEILRRFFEKFYRGRNGNFGLGLYITKRIIEFHEGEAWAENDGDAVKFILKMKRVM